MEILLNFEVLLNRNLHTGFTQVKSECGTAIITTGGSRQQQINTQQEFQTNLCNTDPPGDEVMVSCSTDWVQHRIINRTNLWAREAGCIWLHSADGQEKQSREGKACRESQRGDLIMKTYWEYRQQGNQMIKNLLRANAAGESDNTEARVREKQGIKPCTSTHTQHERHTPRWPTDTPHTEEPAGCLMLKSDGRQIWELCESDICKKKKNPSEKKQQASGCRKDLKLNNKPWESNTVTHTAGEFER